MKLPEKLSKIYELSSAYVIYNTHEAFLKFMLNKRFRNKQSIKWFVQEFYDSCSETEVYNRIITEFVKFVCFIFLASVQNNIQVVPLCDCNNNIRKQVCMAFEQGLFNSTSK